MILRVFRSAFIGGVGYVCTDCGFLDSLNTDTDL